MGLYCSKQLDTTDTFHQFCEKPLYITFKTKRTFYISKTKTSTDVSKQKIVVAQLGPVAPTPLKSSLS